MRFSTNGTKGMTGKLEGLILREWKRRSSLERTKLMFWCSSLSFITFFVILILRDKLKLNKRMSLKRRKKKKRKKRKKKKKKKKGKKEKKKEKQTESFV